MLSLKFVHISTRKKRLTIVAKEEDRKRKDFKMGHNTQITSHSAYVATSTESQGVKIDGFLYPNFMQIPKM